LNSNMNNMSTACPFCQTQLSYPANSMYIQCPKCTQTFNAQQAQPPTSYVTCLSCQTLLSHPPSSLTIQCPKCLYIMDIAPRANVISGVGDSKSSSNRKKRKDPNAPKRASNAYMIFCKERRTQLKSERPELPFGQLGKRLGDMWRSMTAEEKKPYEDRATSDRDRYKGEMNQYQSQSMMKQVNQATGGGQAYAGGQSQSADATNSAQPTPDTAGHQQPVNPEASNPHHSEELNNSNSSEGGGEEGTEEDEEPTSTKKLKVGAIRDTHQIQQFQDLNQYQHQQQQQEELAQ